MACWFQALAAIAGDSAVAHIQTKWYMHACPHTPTHTNK